MSRARDQARIEIRPLEHGDAKRLDALFHSLGDRSRHWFHPHPFDKETAEALVAAIANPDERRYLMIGHLEAREVVVGYGFLMELDAEMPTLGIAIADREHGRGYGERMMRYLIETGRELGKRGIQLTVYDDNAGARHLYERCGFTTRRIVHHMDIVFDKEHTCA